MKGNDAEMLLQEFNRRDAISNRMWWRC